MRILFADESGTPPAPGVASPKYFVVGAIIIPEAVWHRIKDAVFGLKLRRKIRGEIKWRYFAPGNDDSKNPMRTLSHSERDEIRTELYRIIAQERSVRTIAAICSVAAAYDLPSVSTQADIYHLAYKTMSERFQYYLQDEQKMSGGGSEYGIIVCDHRGSGDDEKLRRFHETLIHSTAANVSKYKNLIESLFLQKSHLSIGIQLADLVAGAVWRKYERGDSRWYDLIEPTLRRGPSNKLDGYGLIHCPKTNWR